MNEIADAWQTTEKPLLVAHLISFIAVGLYAISGAVVADSVQLLLAFAMSLFRHMDVSAPAAGGFIHSKVEFALHLVIISSSFNAQ